MNGRLVDLVQLRDGTQRITFDTREDVTQLFNKLKDKPVSINIKAAHQRRSLDANAYAWVLIDKLAEELGLPRPRFTRNSSGISVAFQKLSAALMRPWKAFVPDGRRMALVGLLKPTRAK